MKILVTGGAGFIGREVCKQLLELGHSVVVLDLLTYAADPYAMRELTEENPKKFALAQCDCRDIAMVAGVMSGYEISHVIHLAAESHVDRSISGPQSFLDANVLGTYGVLEGIRTYGVDKVQRLVHVSTDEVFGDLPLDGRANARAGQFNEASPYRPSSPYSASKAASDHLIRAWGRTFDVRYCLTYGANTYGPGQLPDKLIPMAIVNGLRGQPITVHGSGKNVRSWLHVQDHAAGIIAALLRGTEGEAYCLEDRCEMSNIQVVTEVCRQLGELRPRQVSYDQLIQYVNDRPGNDLRYSMDSGKARRELGWAARRFFGEAVAEAILDYTRRYV